MLKQYSAVFYQDSWIASADPSLTGVGEKNTPPDMKTGWKKTIVMIIQHILILSSLIVLMLKLIIIRIAMILLLLLIIMIMFWKHRLWGHEQRVPPVAPGGLHIVVYIYIYIYSYSYIYIYIYITIYVHTCIYILRSLRAVNSRRPLIAVFAMETSLPLSLSIYIYIHICVYLYIERDVYMYASIYVYMYIYIYIHTYSLNWPFTMGP